MKTRKQWAKQLRAVATKLANDAVNGNEATPAAHSENSKLETAFADHIHKENAHYLERVLSPVQQYISAFDFRHCINAVSAKSEIYQQLSLILPMDLLNIITKSITNKTFVSELFNLSIKAFEHYTQDKQWDKAKKQWVSNLHAVK